MFREIQWGRGLVRLWAVITVLWLAASIYSVVIPHYFTEAPLGPPSAAEFQKSVQDQLDCRGYDDETNTDKPWLHWKCAKVVGQDPLLDISVQEANDGTLTLNDANGEQFIGVPKNLSAKQIAEKLYLHFAEEASKRFYEPVPRDALLVLGPPVILLLLGLAGSWVLRGFDKR
ncbi:hypothetical protein R69658_07235 [Paraburkholderia aspalathi]|uniref:PepSY-associated TM region n=1 Tax=Paraburkholderia aspalathi TaxID=1324617 RepID=A0ABM8T2L3_9BURK|nr:hypothetical protein [Paraburkholderia aspalathi]MBK3823578.1 hypothetical protein [Paraburkholderia aspalathi]MBK3835408.1 hypothetical protein [Paraburkholderia aspalathi]MBK3865160.1 hypothetical protein [Paraburkholderia aspalathi]CAE6852632.1 hypothetical protein R69658_07235 [Paraburkholderia aspalathi]